MRAAVEFVNFELLATPSCHHIIGLINSERKSGPIANYLPGGVA